MENYDFADLDPERVALLYAGALNSMRDMMREAVVNSKDIPLELLRSNLQTLDILPLLDDIHLHHMEGLRTDPKVQEYVNNHPKVTDGKLARLVAMEEQIKDRRSDVRNN